jgi:mannitol/fructose-specific phosphotransferase system IIA component (Ntr-type)
LERRAEVTGLDAAEVCDGVLVREQLMATGIGNGLAVPHARLRGLAMPVVTVGLSCAGIDFDAPDGTPAHVIFLILTPVHDDGAQLEILADIATTFKVKEIREQAVGVATFTEFLLLRIAFIIRQEGIITEHLRHDGGNERHGGHNALDCSTHSRHRVDDAFGSLPRRGYGVQHISGCLK